MKFFETSKYFSLKKSTYVTLRWIGILGQLISIYKKVQISERSSFIFLLIDVLQLAILLYLTGGISNPFIIFLIIPSVFSSSNLGSNISLFLVLITTLLILILTFFYQPLPYPINLSNIINPFVYYSISISLIIALFFLNYFALSFGNESRIRKEALNRMEEVMAKEHEILSLGGQAAAT